MKLKISIFALLVVGLVFGFAFTANATINFTATGGTNAIATAETGVDAVVVGFKAVEDNTANNSIKKFHVENAAGGTATGAHVSRISIYLDKNSDGKLDSGDTLVAGATTTTTTNYTNNGTDVDLTPTTPEPIAKNATKYFLVVATIANTVPDGTTFGGMVSGTDGLDVVITAAGVHDGAVALDVVATHLVFKSTGYNPQVATGAEILVTHADFLWAVDDHGNLDTGFGDTVQFTAESYTTGESTLGGLTATLNTAKDVKVGSSDTPNAATIASGKLATNTVGNAGDLESLVHVTGGPVTIVARTVTRMLEGSVTICNDAYPAIAGIGVSAARGVEVYDRDHDGHIDYLTIFYSVPVTSAGAVVGDFTIGGGYSFAALTGGSFDAGGVGIRNAGEYGVTLEITEKSGFDTAVKPNASFAGGANKIEDRAAATDALTFSAAQVVTVDKARPVLISAVTKDDGTGEGSASNGLLDSIVFTYSEPIQNVTASSNSNNVLIGSTAGVALVIDPSDGLSFNQGGGATVSNVSTIPVGELTPNTGVTPTIWYNNANTNKHITDFAMTAVGGDGYNSFYPDKTFYAGKAVFVSTDGAPMVVSSVRTRDMAGTAGKIDALEIIFSESAIVPGFTGVEFYSSIPAFASATNANGIYTVTGVSGAGTTWNFVITEVSVTGIYDSEATPAFRYDQNLGNITDAVGNEIANYGPGALTHPPTLDDANPVIVKVQTGDDFTDSAKLGDSDFEAAAANGRLDDVLIVYSEKVKTGTGAENGGTALDNAVAQFGITHGLGAARTKMTTAKAIGAPVWTDKEVNGVTSTELLIPFQELSAESAGLINGGDTGQGITVAYTASETTGYNFIDYAATANYLITAPPASTDGAAPFLVDTLGKDWGDQSVASITTYDVWENVAVPAGNPDTGDNDGNGDGFLDGFVLKFTENLGAAPANGATLKAFTTTLGTGGALTFNDAAATAAVAGAELTITGVPNKSGGWDTAIVPALSFNKDIDVVDGTGNKVAAFTDRASYDKAPPVIVAVNGGDPKTQFLFTFSEPVWAHDANALNVSFDTVTIAGSTLFGYSNLSTGIGASSITSAKVTQYDVNKLAVTLNTDLTIADIAADLVWVKASGIFDDANAVDSGLADNVAINDFGGANITVNIFDDVVDPWIIGAETVDFDGNGLVDHIKWTFSEKMKDSTLKGYISANALSGDISATWVITGYSGTVKWSLFDDTDTGKAAAIAAGEPVFSGNKANDTVLYMKLEEDVAKFNLVGSGTTGFAPTITWSTGTTLGDLGGTTPNPLDTVSTEDSPKATNGVVKDKVGPVIMSAVYTPESSPGSILLGFSEPIVDSKYSKVNLVDFNFGSKSSFSEKNANLWGFTWGTYYASLTLDLKSGFTLPVNDFYGIQFATSFYTVLYEDADDNAPNVYGANLYAAGGGALHEAKSPISSAQYPAKTKTLGLVKITSTVQPVLEISKFEAASKGTPMGGEEVTIKWNSQNVDNVDLYVSFNSGETYELVVGSTTPASDGQMTWIARMSVTNIKIASAADVTVADTQSTGVVYDGDNVNGGSIGAPANLTMVDFPNDNGRFLIASFTVSADHLTAVISYQFYKGMALDPAAPDVLTDVLWATVAAGVPDDNNMMSVIVPTIDNAVTNWKVLASTGSVLSDYAAKPAIGLPVATVVYGGAAKVASGGVIVSALSDVFSAGAIDNIAPSAFVDYLAADNPGDGVLVSWTAPADHGLFGTYTFLGQIMNIYGVDTYEVYRKESGAETFDLIGTAVPGSMSFVDDIENSSTVYQYQVVAVDDYLLAHPDEAVETGIRSAIAKNDLAGDYDSDNVVGFSDFIFFAGNYGMSLEANAEDFVTAYDFNADDTVNFSDFILFAAQYGETLGSAKAVAGLPTSDIPFSIGAEIDESTSMYYVTVSIDNAENLNGYQFFLTYDPEAVEFVEDSINGLVGLNMTDVVEDGTIRVTSAFVGEAFNGDVTLGFTSRGVNRNIDFEIVHAMLGELEGVAIATNLAEYSLKALPTVYTLSQNFPNPFNPTTTLEYSIPKSGNVELAIYNITGQKVRTLVSEKQDAAFYKVVWDGRNDFGESVGSGLYFYKLVSGNFSKIEKMNLVK